MTADPAARRAKNAVYRATYRTKHREKVLAADRERAVAYREANPGKVRASRRAYSASHRAEKKKACIEWRAANIESVRAKEAAYRAAHREDRKLKARAYRAANKHVSQKYYIENADAMKEKCAAWVKANPHACRANAAKRRARKLEATGTFTRHDVAEILKMQRGRCAYCRVKVGKKFHADHIRPLALGGSNGRRNIQITCQTCNQRKHAKDPVTYAQQIGMVL